MEGGGKVLLLVTVLVAVLTLHTTNCKPSGSYAEETTARLRKITAARDRKASVESFVGQILLNLIPIILNRVSQSRPPSSNRLQSRLQQQDQETLEDIFKEELGDETVGELEKLLNQFTEPPATKQTPLPAKNQQGEDEEEDIARELEQLLTLIDTSPAPAKAQKSQPHQGKQRGKERAKAEIISQRNWDLAQQCLNDFLTNDGTTPSGSEQRAIMEEAKKVMTGEMALDKASAQLNLNWPTIRSCIDRFANSYTPTASTNTVAKDQFFSRFFSSIFGSDPCLQTLTIVAITGDVENAFTTTPPSLQITTFDGEIGSVLIPIITGQEFQQAGSDFWQLDFDDFGFNECVELEDIESVALVAGGNDGWNIFTIITLVQDTNEIQSVLTSDVGLSSWVDGNGSQERRRVELSLNTGSDPCLQTLTIIAITGDSQNAVTTTPPSLQITTFDGEIGSVLIPIITGQEFQQAGSDFWQLNFGDFGFSECVELDDIESVALVAEGNDGWNIFTIITLVRDTYGIQSVLTSDTELGFWLDGNGFGDARDRLELTLNQDKK